MLIFNRADNKIADDLVINLPDILDNNVHLVFNNSKVLKARLFASTIHGGKAEFLLLKKISETKWSAIVSRAKRHKTGKLFSLPGGLEAEISSIEDNTCELIFSKPIEEQYLEKYGHIPLPPYIKRPDMSNDSLRYQTVYANTLGSAAAPTAGLHFTDKALKRLGKKTDGLSFVTLHVGMGTFLPIRTENIEDHSMHTEEYEITGETAARLNAAKSAGKKILAIGTTSVRTLESACMNGQIKAGRSSTDLFIRPGYKFKFVDMMLTNFHTPGSSLIVMVSAFAGSDNIKKVYDYAIGEKYRFFSYGDAMLIR